MRKITLIIIALSGISHAQIRDANGDRAIDEDLEPLNGKITILNNLDVQNNLVVNGMFQGSGSILTADGGGFYYNNSIRTLFFGDLFEDDITTSIVAYGSDNNAGSRITLADDEILFRTSNITNMHVSPNGVAMGGLYAAEKLHLFNGNLMLQSDDHENLKIKFNDTDAGTLHELYVQDESFKIDKNGTNRLMIKHDGKVGIGNSNPQEALHINGSVRGNATGGALRVKSQYGYLDIGAQNTTWAQIFTDRSKVLFNKDVYTASNAFSSYNNDLLLKTSGTERFRISNSTGNIGVNIVPELDTQFCVSTSEKVGIKSVTSHNSDYQFGILSAVNRENTKALSVLLLENGTYKDKFAVMGNGKVFSTEVEVRVPIFPDYVFEKDYNLLPLSKLKDFIIKNKHLPNIPKGKDIVSNGLELGDMQVKQMEKIEELTLYIIEQDERIKKLEILVEKLISEKE